ncbi:hypothetical protein OIV83_000113 [Microbotryomycetes sp. JL201]|nr:hypothetical protein OIV83_000113 [Microbotryomycetes sp. JL201]
MTAPDDDSDNAKRTRLEVPTVPASRFVLSPPSSDLLSRVQAFLPQMKAANDQLDSHMLVEEAQGDSDGGQEEAVTLEVISSDSSDDDDDDDSSDDTDSSDSDDDDDDQEHAENESMQDDEDGQAMSHLLNIAQRPKVFRKDLVQDVEQ